MASAALPLLFPAVQIDGRWYGDGGVRLTTPLSPAIHLGARRIIAVSTRFRPATPQEISHESQSYPTPAQVGGVLMNAVFLDLLDQDAKNLERINGLIEDNGRPDSGSLHPIDLVLIRPSQDLGALAGEYEPRLPKGLRFLTRGLGARESRGSDFISMLMFQRDYVEKLIEIGEADGDARKADLDRLLV